MKYVRTILMIIAGAIVLVFGVAFIVLPDPSFVVIPAGLAILAIEFAWARGWLHKARELLQKRKRAVARREFA